MLKNMQTSSGYDNINITVVMYDDTCRDFDAVLTFFLHVILFAR